MAEPAAASPAAGWRVGVLAALAAAWLLPAAHAWEIAPDLGHAWAVPLLMGFLWWERWAERPLGHGAGRVGAGAWLGAVALVALHGGTRLFLTPYPLWPWMLTLFTLTVAAAALGGAWLLGGGALARWLAGPLVLVVATLPAPVMFDRELIQPLRKGIAQLAAEISNLAGQPALASGTSVRLANDWVGVDEACGGIRSLQACLMIALFFGEWYRFSLGRRALLVLVGLLAAVGGNAARVIFLSLRAGAGVEAVHAAHDAAGWAAMIGSIALTALLAWRWGGKRLPAPRATPPRGRTPAAAAWRWAAVVAGLFLASEIGVRLWYAHGHLARRDVARWRPALPTANPAFRGEPLSEVAREMLRPDAFLSGRWPLAYNVYASAYYVEWRSGQTARTTPFFHNPTVCLPLSGCELIEQLPDIAVPWAGGEITFFAYRFRRLGENLLVVFTIWDPDEGRLLAPTVAPTWRAWFASQWRDVREAREHQPAQLLAVSLPWEENVAARMRELLGQIVQPADAR